VRSPLADDDGVLRKRARDRAGNFTELSLAQDVVVRRVLVFCIGFSPMIPSVAANSITSPIEVQGL